MPKHNASNVRIKRKYRNWLKDARGHSEATLDAMDKAVARFEEHTKYRDFKTFHFEQARAFKVALFKQQGKDGKTLSKATVTSTLRTLKVFFQWLAQEPGYRSKLNYSDTEYFNPSEKDLRIASTKRNLPPPSIEQIERVIDRMPTGDMIALRNRALIACVLVTGIRDGAAASLKLKHVNVKERFIYQDAREVKTKFSKSFRTYFFPVGDKYVDILLDWIRYLNLKLKFGPNDPLFPTTLVELSDARRFEAVGLKPEHWSNAGPIRQIFKKAFLDADLPYFNPHSFRKTLAQYGERLCTSPESFKAWSQNLGHEGVMTTFNSYGEVQEARQGELINALSMDHQRQTETEMSNQLSIIAEQLLQMSSRQ